MKRERRDHDEACAQLLLSHIVGAEVCNRGLRTDKCWWLSLWSPRKMELEV